MYNKLLCHDAKLGILKHPSYSNAYIHPVHVSMCNTYVCVYNVSLQLLSTIGLDEEDAIWKYFLEHMVEDITRFQTGKHVSLERAEFEQLLSSLITNLTISKGVYAHYMLNHSYICDNELKVIL